MNRSPALAIVFIAATVASCFAAGFSLTLHLYDKLAGRQP